MLFLAKVPGISFQEIKKCNSFEHHAKPYAYAVCLLLWALSNSITHVRNFSYSHDQDHVHIHSHAILVHWKIATISIHHKIKVQVKPWLSLSPKLPSRMWAMQKEIKDAYPKKVCHMPTRHVKKKKKRKDAYPKKVCHMLARHVKQKEKKRNKKIAHI